MIRKSLPDLAEVAIELRPGELKLPGTLTIPQGAHALVLFAHGSGSSRLSPRNTFVAQVLHAVGMGTLLFDLLTPREDCDYETRFNIALLSERLVSATRWVRSQSALDALTLGYFGASTGAAAALVAAAQPDVDIGAVVSRGGRPDLVGADVLTRVVAPTLLIVGGEDHTVITLNRDAYSHLACEKSLHIVPGATHLFEEPGTLEAVADLASKWFTRWLGTER